MNCDINKSVNVGFFSALILMLITYIILPQIKVLDLTKLLFLFVVFFVISTSMDYFNYCYTKCKSVGSSIKFSLFTVALIYLFITLFLDKKELHDGEVVSIGLNIALLTALHYYLCDTRIHA